MALAESLSEGGVEVLLVERNSGLVQSALNVVSSAVQGDATNARALDDAGLKECEVAVVAIGGNVEASLLATANCKELGVPNVIAKATSELHGKILEKLGADQVIFPDRESAHRLARSITNRGAFDLLEISEGYSIAEIDVPDAARGKTLAEADLRKKTGLTVLCIRREGGDAGRSVIIPQPTDRIEEDDKLVVFGETKQIDALS